MNIQPLIAGAALFCCATLSFAQEEPAEAGQMIFADPNTGEIRQPTVEEWSQLPRAIAAKARVFPQQVLPDGTILIPAEAAMQQITATVDDDGNLHIDCDHDHAPVAP